MKNKKYILISLFSFFSATGLICMQDQDISLLSFVKSVKYEEDPACFEFLKRAQLIEEGKNKIVKFLHDTKNEHSVSSNLNILVLMYNEFKYHLEFDCKELAKGFRDNKELQIPVYALLFEQSKSRYARAKAKLAKRYAKVQQLLRDRLSNFLNFLEQNKGLLEDQEVIIQRFRQERDLIMTTKKSPQELLNLYNDSSFYNAKARKNLPR